MKRLIYIFILTFILMLVSCSKDEKENIDFFDIHKAKDIGSTFMENMAYGTIEDIGNLCSDKVKTSKEYNELIDNKIGAYKVEKNIEGADYAYIDYIAIRKDNENLRADLDNLSIKIIKKDGAYLVDEIKAKSNKEIYVDNNILRVRNEETGENNILLKLKDLPKEMYSKGSDVIVNKKSINNKEFSRVSLSFSGDKVGIVSTDGENIALLLAEVKEEKDTLGQNNSSGNEETNINDMEKNIEDALEAPIVKKLIEYDLINNAEVEELLFSNDDGELILQIKQDGESFIKIYRNNTGELIDLNLEKEFPKEKYTSKIKCVNDKGLLVEVESKDKSKKNECLIDLKENKIKILH